jgi:hypothetical protein
LVPNEEFADQIGADAGPGQHVAYIDSADFGSEIDSGIKQPRGKHRDAVGRRIFEEFKVHKGRVLRHTAS